MTTAYWCILIFMWFPSATAFLGKIMVGNMLSVNHDPRHYLESKPGMSRRLYCAHLNAVEIFAPFSAAVIIAHLMGQLPQSTIDNLAVAFIISRIIYVIAYAMDWAMFRTLTWLVGMGFIACYFILPLVS